MPKVSVVLPTYNRAHVLARAIDSVLHQTFQDLELIVVDDSSTDGTTELLQSYSSDMIRVIKLNQNVGPSCARNIGIQSARGELVAFQDSDDEWVSEKLQIQVNQMAAVSPGHRTVGASYTRFILKDDGGLLQRIVPADDITPLDGNIYSTLLRNNVVDTPTLLVRKEVFDDVGVFDETIERLEDWDLALRIARTYDFAFVDQPLILSHWSANGVNNRQDPKGMYRILSKHLDGFFAHCPRRGAEWFWRVGDDLLKGGDALVGRKALWTSIQLSAKSYVLLAWLGSLLGSRAYANLSTIFSYSKRSSALR